MIRIYNIQMGHACFTISSFWGHHQFYDGPLMLVGMATKTQTSAAKNVVTLFFAFVYTVDGFAEPRGGMLMSGDVCRENGDFARTFFFPPSLSDWLYWRLRRDFWCVWKPAVFWPWHAREDAEKKQNKRVQFSKAFFANQDIPPPLVSTIGPAV